MGHVATEQWIQNSMHLKELRTYVPATVASSFKNSKIAGKVWVSGKYNKSRGTTKCHEMMQNEYKEFIILHNPNTKGQT